MKQPGTSYAHNGDIHVAGDSDDPVFVVRDIDSDDVAGAQHPSSCDHERSLVMRVIGAVRRQLARLWLRLKYFGWRVECPCCGHRFRAFAPHPYGRKREHPGICPTCEAFERHRALLLYLRDRTSVLSDQVELLDCAPTPALMRHLVGRPNIRCVSVDLESPLAALKADLMKLPFPSQSFDVVLCSHVLEHVADDRRAMRELARVLRPRGFAAIIVPFHGGLSETLEDPSVTTPEQRLNTYGQADHVRLYGRDFPTRLAESGFAVERVSMYESLSQAEVARWGLSPYDDIYICRAG